jgi:hypothetical protein
MGDSKSRNNAVLLLEICHGAVYRIRPASAFSRTFSCQLLVRFA